MQFTLIDRITDLQPGVSITAYKSLSLAEEYLQDHFPRFPVMPGVLMLEAMFQACAWLSYVSDDFAHSSIRLREARNVKYADFVEPGRTLRVTATLFKQNENALTFKAQGQVEQTTAVSGRLVLERFNLNTQHPQREPLDQHARREMRELYQVLYQPQEEA